MTFGVVWLCLAAALCAVIALWGLQISGFLGHGGDRITAAPVARATAVPRIVTDYTPNASSSTESLCAELAPQAATVTVETPTGVVLSTLECATGTGSTSGCLFSQTTGGMLIVISQKTGSLLTEAQAANCSK